MLPIYQRAAPALVVLSLAAAAAAQSTTAFTAEDTLKVATINVLDITEDGARIAAAVRRPFDNETIAHGRFGDPTYLAPSRVTLQVIDARSGTIATPFREPTNVRNAAWTRDGGRLAILVARDTAPKADGFPAAALFVWDADKRTLAEVTPKPAQYIAVNSDVAWTPDGAAIVVTVRDPRIDRQARETFTRLTEGPVIVHKSSEPFHSAGTARSCS